MRRQGSLLLPIEDPTHILHKGKERIIKEEIAY